MGMKQTTIEQCLKIPELVTAGRYLSHDENDQEPARADYPADA